MDDNRSFQIDIVVPHLSLNEWREKTLQWIKKEKSEIKINSDCYFQVIHGNNYKSRLLKDVPMIMEFRYEESNDKINVKLINAYYDSSIFHEWKVNIEDYFSFLNILDKKQLQRIYVEKDFEDKMRPQVYYLTLTVIFYVGFNYFLFKAPFMWKNVYFTVFLMLFFFSIFIFILHYYYKLYNDYDKQRIDLFGSKKE